MAHPLSHVHPPAANAPASVAAAPPGAAPQTGMFALLYRPGPAWIPGRPVRVQALGPHRAYMQALAADGRLLAAGPFLDDSGGIVLLHAASPDEARDVLAVDPAVVSGVFVGDVRPWVAVFDRSRVLAERLAADEGARERTGRNADAVRRLYRAVEARDPNAFWPAYDASVVIHEAPSLPYGGEYHGADGARRHTLGYLAAWDALQGDAERRLDPEVLADGDRVVVLYRQRACDPGAREALDAPAVAVYRLTNGRVAESRMYHFDAGAVAAFLRRAHGASGTTAPDGAAEGGHGAAVGESALNALLAAGEFGQAFERWYAEDVVMHDADGTETVGKAANRAREAAFFVTVAGLSARPLRTAVAGGTGFSEWEYAINFGAGRSLRFRQVAVREWRGGLVARETFYHPGLPAWAMAAVAAAVPRDDPHRHATARQTHAAAAAPGGQPAAEPLVGGTIP